ncbi:hypothetical protein F0562_004245 [Nyssa sinensis]|uniref:Peptidase S54 rhomboid domain-containing protein n=1 Tax=Nyssa sinensis TaxID=561372 RepID=A0A5J5BYV2_9ASTE|nr:hypothetical protein F0562_004245 [Nyssa sinensis]
MEGLVLLNTLLFACFCNYLGIAFQLSSSTIYMAVVPICYKISYKAQSVSTPKEIRQNERGFTCSYISVREDCGCFSAISSDKGRRWFNDATNILLKANTRKGTDVSRAIMTEGSVPPRVQKAACHLRLGSDNASQREKVLCTVRPALESSSAEKQLRALDSYFGKLQNNTNRNSSDSLNKRESFLNRSHQFKAKKGLRSLDDYLGKLNKDAKSKNCVSSASDSETIEVALDSIRGDSRKGGRKKLKNYELKNKDDDGSPNSSSNETSDLYLISILASINIAVFLFEIASPISNPDLELFSLPSVYGAKINHLILIGEWWRLVTPMFLHSGILHVALGCWVLLTFGPRVCRVYGSFTFFLMYILGGISGNLISFLHTPAPTVGGTGPVFAVIGAWLIYQIQNEDVTTKDVSEGMIQKAIIATALSCILSNFGPIDDWTHFGAAFTGVVYGFFTCPTLQVDDTASKSGQKEGITLVRRYADPSGVMGACSVLAGLMHLRAWRSDSLAIAASSGIISWSITALAFGLVCKEIILGGHRGKRLQTLEAFISISAVSQLMYLVILHAGIFSSRFGPDYGTYGSQYWWYCHDT